MELQRNFIGRFLASCVGGKVFYTRKTGFRAGFPPSPASVSADFRADPSRERRNRFDSADRIGENGKPQGGGVAQLGEHHVRNVGVEGSIPFSSTILPSRGEGWCPPKRRRGRAFLFRASRGNPPFFISSR